MKILTPRSKGQYNFKIGLIGCGNIAHTQLTYILNYIRKDNIALCDSDRLRMSGLVRRFKTTNQYEKVDDLLENFAPDIVHILTPPQTHLSIAIDCLRNDAHLFIEKPMCVTPKEAETIGRMAEARKRSVCIDHLLPFDPLFIRAKKLSDSGVIGNLDEIYITDWRNLCQGLNGEGGTKWLKSLPGGVLFDLLPHHLSIINLFCSDPRIVDVDCRRQGLDITALKCSFASVEADSQLRVEIDHPVPKFSVKLQGSDGHIMVDIRNRTIEVRASNSGKEVIYKKI